MRNKLVIGLLVFGLAATVAVGTRLTSAQPSQPQPAQASCQQQVAIVNNRSRLLETYQASNNRSFKQQRKQWANYIAYAGQWLPKDAEKTRDALYKYDQLHKSLNDELDKQIGTYKYLETDPLDCSDGKKDQLNKKLAEIKGMSGKKVVGGHALIQKKTQEESKFASDEFDKKTKSLVKKLHKEKTKKPKPNKPKTTVNDN